jgi:diacylglycerol kinase family enzyme
VVAVGTANDFARAMGLPRDLEDAVELAASGTRTKRLDLGRVGDRPFVNAAAAGLSPVAAEKAHGLKRVLGPLAYTVGALRAGLFAKPVRCSVTVDGDDFFQGDAWQVIVGLTGAFGGGAEVDADPSDGQLDVVVIEAGSRAALIARGYGLRRGQVEGQRGVHTASGCAVEIDHKGGAGFNVDGELVDDKRLAFTVEPRSFDVVVGT